MVECAPAQSPENDQKTLQSLERLMSKIRFIDPESIGRCDAPAFHAQQPFPWVSLSRFLTEEGFGALHRDFPDIRFFERHENLPKPYGQRPHNRYYLAYEESIYHPHESPAQGVVRHHDLPLTWQRFLEELEGEEYRRFLQSLLGISQFEVRYAWHIGVTGSEVSPHRDAENKLATHIFYFNTSDDWSMAWGGETLVLCGKRTPTMNPDFDDFDRVIPVPCLDNRSFLFKNGPGAWHGVRAIRCPAGRYRRLFNVILTQRPGLVARVFRTRLLRSYAQPFFSRLSNRIRRS